MLAQSSPGVQFQLALLGGWGGGKHRGMDIPGFLHNVNSSFRGITRIFFHSDLPTAYAALSLPEPG